MGQQRESGPAAGWCRHPGYAGAGHPGVDGGDEGRRSGPGDLPGPPHLIRASRPHKPLSTRSGQSDSMRTPPPPPRGQLFVH